MENSASNSSDIARSTISSTQIVSANKTSKLSWAYMGASFALCALVSMPQQLSLKTVPEGAGYFTGHFLGLIVWPFLIAYIVTRRKQGLRFSRWFFWVTLICAGASGYHHRATMKDIAREASGKQEARAGNVFGEHTLPDGTVEDERIEFPDGEKYFHVTRLLNGSQKVERDEFPDGQKEFDLTWLPDGTVKAQRVEFPDGRKDFDRTRLPDGTEKTALKQAPDGEKQFDTTELPDGTGKAGRLEFTDGERDFNMTWLPDGTYKKERVEFPDGAKWFEVTKLQDGSEKVKCIESPSGKKRFNVTIPADGTEKARRATPTNIPGSVTPVSKQRGFAEGNVSQR
jgi:hypothetical protein